MKNMLELRIAKRDQLRKAGDLDGLTPQAADWLVERATQAEARGPLRRAAHHGLEWISQSRRG